MFKCPHCGQDDGTENRCCWFCGWPGSPPPKESEVRQSNPHHDFAPDGRAVETNPLYQRPERIRNKEKG